MADARKIGLFGGTFNPIHNGHVHAAVAVADLLNLEKVIFIPSEHPPHKLMESRVSGAQRLEMVRLAIEGNRRLSVSDIEIARGGESFTLVTLQSMKRVHTDALFTFILGVDVYQEINTWFRFREVLPLADWAVIARPGYALSTLLAPLADFGAAFHKVDENTVACDDPKVRIFFLPIPETDVSSSQVRAAVREHRPIDGMVADKVSRYIAENRLYTDD